jgi:hypothetical protein
MCPEMLLSDNGLCLLGKQCSMAHSAEELLEWKTRFSKRQEILQLNRIGQTNDGGECKDSDRTPAFSEELLEKWVQSRNPEKVMSESVEGVQCRVNGETSITMSSKICTNEWNFVLGEFHDQADAEWIVIRGLLRGHNDTPCGRPTPGCPGIGCPYGVSSGFIWWFYLLRSNIISKHCPPDHGISS